MSVSIPISVIGVGGGGGTAVHHIKNGHTPDEITFCAVNTDIQALENVVVDQSLQIGEQLTHGFGTGACPEKGRQAAEEDYAALTQLCAKSRLVFITAGMGGGTGTGASPVIAQAAKEMGALTIAVVTKPFSFEGDERMENAVKGIEVLRQYADMVICIANDRVSKNAGPNTPINDAFRMTDDVLSHILYALYDLIAQVGIINIDFNDVASVLTEKGDAMVGYGEATGEKATLQATRYAMASPLLERTEIIGAKRVVMSITGSAAITMNEVEEAVTTVRNEVRGKTHVAFGVTINPDMNDNVKVTIIATGLPEPKERKERKVLRHSPLDERLKQDNFDFLPAEKGLFIGLDPTLIDGVNYDTPTYVRWRRNLVRHDENIVVNA